MCAGTPFPEVKALDGAFVAFLEDGSEVRSVRASSGV